MASSRRIRRRIRAASIFAGCVVILSAVIVGMLFLDARRNQAVLSAETTTFTPQPIATTTAPASTSEEVRGGIAVVGDSFTSDQDMWWPDRVGNCTAQPITTSGVGGSGFFNPGSGESFGAESRRETIVAANPDVVIFETAYNDSWRAEWDQETVRQAVVDTVTAYRSELPEAQFVIVGPFWSESPEPVGIQNNQDALESASKELGVTYIDATGWLQDESELGNDGRHPNTEGHKVIAQNVIEELVAAGIAERSGAFCP